MKFKASSSFRFLRFTAAALSASLWISQVDAAPAPQDVAPAQRAAPSATASITVPAGTTVPLNLVSLIKSKSTPVGGAVRASVAFPVTVGTRLAIPAGVFVEGQLVQAVFPKGYKRPKGQPQASPLKVRFTRLIYPNGYTVAFDAELSESTLPALGAPAPVEAEAALDLPPLTERGQGPYVADAFAAAMPEPQQQTTPTVTNPYAHAGPNPAVIYGPIVAAAAVVGLVLLVGHHHENLDSVLYDAGYQFQMTLAAPLVLDRSKIGKQADVTPGYGAEPGANR